MTFEISAQQELELGCLTPYSWAAMALRQELALLNDHAHLERKAASNALELLFGWPGGERAPARWVKVLSAIAKDESAHLAQVLKVIERRGGSATRHHKSSYAQGLRALVRKGAGPRELLDRLLVSALIELRSAERFLLLGLTAEPKDLSLMYRALWRSECGHYTVFLDLAREVESFKDVEERWQFMLRKEAALIQAQAPGSRIHSWVSSVAFVK